MPRIKDGKASICSKAQKERYYENVHLFFEQATFTGQETGRGTPPISFDSWKPGWQLYKPPTRRRRRSTRRTRNPRWSKKLGPWEPGGHPDERFARPTSLCLSSSQLNCQHFFIFESLAATHLMLIHPFRPPHLVLSLFPILFSLTKMKFPPTWL